MDDAEQKALMAQIGEAMATGLVPHNTALGLAPVEFGPGVATVRLPYATKLIGNPVTGVLHGGAITALIDATSGIAVLLRLTEATRIATLDLRIDYLSPSVAGQDVVARAECFKVTRHVAFVRAVAYHDDPGDPIASAAATFMIFREGDSPVGAVIRSTR